MVVDQATVQAELEALRTREKARVKEGDIIAAPGRGEVDGATPLIGENEGVALLDVF